MCIRDSTTTLPLEVFTQRNFFCRFYSIVAEFYLKTQKSLFGQLFWGLRSNLRALSIACWKSRCWFSVRHNWIFSLSLTTRCYKRKSVEVGVFRFRRDGSVWAQISNRSGRRPPTTVGVRKLEWLPFRVVRYIRSVLFGFVTKQTRVWRTDRQNYDRYIALVSLPAR